MEPKGKTVLITGSSSGIGKATALRFAKEGSNIVVNYRENEEGAGEVVDEIRKRGVRAVSVQADLAKENEIKKLIDKTLTEFCTADEIADAFVFLARNDAMTGQIIYVDGGFTLK